MLQRRAEFVVGRDEEDHTQGFEIRLRKNFGHGRNQQISRNFGRNSFSLFLKILLNIFKLLFPKFSNFGGGRNQQI